MKLESGVKITTIREESDDGTYLVVKCPIEGAMIEIRGFAREAITNGLYTKFLPFGKYTYEITAPMYQKEMAVANLTAEGGKVTQNISLKPDFAKITLVADGDIYINEERKGTNSWSGNLAKGPYRVEVRKTSHRSTARTITVEAGKNQSVTLDAPTPIYGKLNINANGEADIYIDGKATGKTSPDILSNILVGEHKISLKANGFTADDKTITVEECKIANLSFELKKQTVEEGEIENLSFELKKQTTPTVSQDKYGIEMVFVRGGSFTMGAEKPTHQVTLSDFYIGKYEVTQEQWKAVMGSNPSYFSGSNLPVEKVSWNSIVGTSGTVAYTINGVKYHTDGFCYKLSQAVGGGVQYRLPTEAEWEYAAKGGEQTHNYTYSGSNKLDAVAWYFANSGKTTHAVGSKAPNELGIYDMSGNVWEWCSDWYGSYSSSSQTNPTGASSGYDRVLRGGSWFIYDGNCSVSSRFIITPDYSDSYYGFRLACSSK